MGHRRHRSDDLAVARTSADLFHKASVDLQDVDLEPLKVGKRRVTGSEVVEGETHAELRQGCQCLLNITPLTDVRGFCDLQTEPRRWDTVSTDYFGDTAGELGSESSRPETFTAIVNPLGQPSREVHSASWQQASFKTNESILAISPCCSAKGTKSFGSTTHARDASSAPTPRRRSASVLQGEERLIEQEQLPVLDCTAQLGLEEARPGAYVMDRVIQW